MLQAFTQTPDEAVRTGCVPVRAERVDLQRDFAAVDRGHLALLHHLHRTPHDEIRIVDDGTLTRPWRQRSIRFVRAIGERFGRDLKAVVSADLQHVRAGQPEHDERTIDRRDGARDRRGERRVASRHVVERAMRLHVPQAHALRRSDRSERTDLIDRHVFDLLGRHAHVPPPEADEVGKSGMGTDGDVGVARQPDRLAHHGRIAAMKAARDVRRRHAGQHFPVRAHFPGTERFPHIAVQIDAIRHQRSCPSVMSRDF